MVEGAPKEQLEEDARVLAEAKSEAEKAAEPEKPLSEGEKAVEGLAQSVAELDAASRVSFKAPEEIPVINVDDILKEKKSRRDASEGEQKLGAVNLEEVENGSRVVFEKVELPQPELASATEKNVSREDVLQKIENEKLPQLEIVDYSPIDFDESEPEPSEKVQDAAQAAKNVKDDKFFTQVLDLTWKDEEV